MKKLSNWINKISNGWVAFTGLVIFLLFTALVLPNQAEAANVYSDDIGSPDTSFIYSAEELYQFAEAYGPQGRSDYIRARVTFDVAWPLVYLAFLTTAIAWATQKAGKQSGFWEYLNLVPVFGLVFDYLENMAVAVTMARYPGTTPILPQIASIFTTLKWLFIGGSFVILALVIAIIIWQKFQSGIRPNS